MSALDPYELPTDDIAPPPVCDFSPGSDLTSGPGVRICGHCGSFLFFQRADAVFCSPGCRLASHRGEPGYTAAGSSPRSRYRWPSRKWEPAPDPAVSVEEANTAARVLADIMQKRGADLPVIIAGAFEIALQFLQEEWEEAQGWLYGRKPSPRERHR